MLDLFAWLAKPPPPNIVIPAQAGIQGFSDRLARDSRDPRLRGG
jgi:hypothetical protein